MIKSITKYLLRRPRMVITLVITLCLAFGISVTDIQNGLIKLAPSSTISTATTATSTAGLPQMTLACANAEEAVVTANVDGDTVKCRTVAEGQENYVRMIGVDTPESVAVDASKNCEEGKLASDHTKAALPVGTTVWLTVDKSNVDRYGRWLRFVWLSQPPAVASTQDIVDTMYNAQLVSQGWAQAKEYTPDVQCASLFDALGQQAIEQQLGVTAKWA